VSIVVPSNAVDPLGLPAVTARAQVTEVAIEFNADGGTTVTISAVEVEAA
jgi:hypothetical protein